MKTVGVVRATRTPTFTRAETGSRLCRARDTFGESRNQPGMGFRWYAVNNHLLLRDPAANSDLSKAPKHRPLELGGGEPAWGRADTAGRLGIERCECSGECVSSPITDPGRDNVGCRRSTRNHPTIWDCRSNQVRNRTHSKLVATIANTSSPDVERGGGFEDVINSGMVDRYVTGPHGVIPAVRGPASAFYCDQVLKPLGDSGGISG